MRIAFLGDSLTSGVPGSSYFSMLNERLPDHTLVNLGRGNDTVVSLYRRVARMPFDEPFDVAFLWIGVNDLAAGNSRLYRAVTALAGQRRSRDLNEFRTYYRLTLDLLCQRAKRLIAVSPLMRGENPDNAWNWRLALLSAAIEDLTSYYPQAEFLDLRAVFAQRFAGKRSSDYVLHSALRVLLDALTLRTEEQIDRIATRRGLHFTLDGLHLNGAGAELVADTFAAEIQDLNMPRSRARATASVRRCTPSLP
jgi:lysophospholipase L1-like esterase